MNTRRKVQDLFYKKGLLMMSKGGGNWLLRAPTVRLDWTLTFLSLELARTARTVEGADC